MTHPLPCLTYHRLPPTSLQQQQLQAQHLSHATHGPPVQLPPHPSGLQPPGIPPVTGSSSGLLALGALGSQAHLAVKDEKNHHELDHRGVALGGQVWAGWAGRHTMNRHGKSCHLESGVSQDLDPSVESFDPVTCPRIAPIFPIAPCLFFRARPPCPSGCFGDWMRAFSKELVLGPLGSLLLLPSSIQSGS